MKYTVLEEWQRSENSKSRKLGYVTAVLLQATDLYTKQSFNSITVPPNDRPERTETCRSW
jgi:hypothetical protein